MEGTQTEKVSLLRLFFVMLKIGAFTVGGGYAMMLMIQHEVTSKRKWVPAEDFPDLMALSQTAPGLIAVNISIFTGYRVRGVAGAVVATLGSCMAPFLFILAIAVFGSSYADDPVVRRVFAGMRPAVVALIAVPMVKMARNSCKRWWQWLLCLTALVLVSILRVSPIYILLTTLIVGVTLSYAVERKNKPRK